MTNWVKTGNKDANESQTYRVKSNKKGYKDAGKSVLCVTRA
jgi:hypothetical protein